MGKGGRLKGALGSYQAAAAKKAAEAKKAANAKAKANAPQMNEKAKRAAKRQRREREVAEAAARAEARNAKDKAAAARAGAAASTAAAESSNDVLRKATIPIKSDDTVLLLGEANFSFALALVKGRGHAGHLVCATSYDSETQCYEKYPDGKDNVDALREAGARVVFNVDAGALEKSKAIGKGRRWSRVVFNFPHCGSGMTDQNRNIRENQVMLLRSLRSVSNVLSDGPPEVEEKKKRKRKPQESDSESEDEEDFGGFDDDEDDMPKTKGYAPSSFTTPNRQGSFLITLLSQPPYSLWDIKGLATRPPPVCPGTREAQPRYTLKRSFEFVPAVWPGYAHRRTIGWREGLSKDDNEEIVGRIGKARTWEFVLREEAE